jgi:DUF971 family protein
MNSTSDPQRIAVSKSTGVKIDWNDGHASEYGLQYLRDRCPCASCSGIHEPAPKPQPSPFEMYKPAPKIAKAEPVGRYAIRITWNDGHNAGIYSWEHLRAICPCPECAALRSRARETADRQ